MFLKRFCNMNCHSLKEIFLMAPFIKMIACINQRPQHMLYNNKNIYVYYKVLYIVLYLVDQNTSPLGDISILWLFVRTSCKYEVTAFSIMVSGTQIISAGCFFPKVIVNLQSKEFLRRSSRHFVRRKKSTVYVCKK